MRIYIGTHNRLFGTVTYAANTGWQVTGDSAILEPILAAIPVPDASNWVTQVQKVVPRHMWVSTEIVPTNTEPTTISEQLPVQQVTKPTNAQSVQHTYLATMTQVLQKLLLPKTIPVPIAPGVLTLDQYLDVLTRLYTIPIQTQQLCLVVTQQSFLGLWALTGTPVSQVQTDTVERRVRGLYEEYEVQFRQAIRPFLSAFEYGYGSLQTIVPVLTPVVQTWVQQYMPTFIQQFTNIVQELRPSP
jgi:hypothetical protein